jgi:hypothetical protein
MDRGPGLVIDIINRGKNILVMCDRDERYTIYVDGEKRQFNLDADAVIRWLGNAMIDGSAGYYVKADDS